MATGNTDLTVDGAPGFVWTRRPDGAIIVSFDGAPMERQATSAFFGTDNRRNAVTVGGRRAEIVWREDRTGLPLVEAVTLTRVVTDARH